MATKADEAKLEDAYQADPQNKAAPNPWEEIAGRVKLQREIYLP